MLRNGAVVNLNDRIAEAQAAGSVRLFSIRHDFPTEWAKFKNVRLGPTTPPAELMLLREEQYPFWSRGSFESVKRVDMFAKAEKTMTFFGRLNATSQPDDAT